MRLWIERTQARDNLNRQMEQLRALRGIDQAIVSTMNLNSILDLLADEVVLQLNADAAAILLLDEEDEMLTFAVGKGFHTDALQYGRVKIGEGLAGKAALEQRTIYERMSGWGTGVLGSALARENFVSYYGIPLIANERLRGVLEIFHWTTLRNAPRRGNAAGHGMICGVTRNRLICFPQSAKKAERCSSLSAR